MALIFDLATHVIGAATWLDGSDDYKEQPSDGADASRPKLWRYEGVEISGSDLTITGTYGADWALLTLVANDLGTVPAVDGNVWNASIGSAVTRFYVDAAVKAEAAYLLPISIYTSDQRGGLTGASLLYNIGFFDDDGTHFLIDAFVGNRPGSDFETSGQFLWSDVVDKYVEWDVRHACETGAGDNGTLVVRMRTSLAREGPYTDLPGTTDGIVLQASGLPLGNGFTSYHSGDITYGMSVALGFDGMPGRCVYAKVWDTATPDTSELPIDMTDPCCDSTPSTIGGGVVTGPDDDIVINPVFSPVLIGGGDVPSNVTPSGNEAWPV